MLIRPLEHGLMQGLRDLDYVPQTDFFQQEPVIPLWYNGAWFQGNTQFWQDFPSSAGTDQNMPVMWNGYIGAMTTVYALANRSTRAGPGVEPVARGATGRLFAGAEFST